MVHARKVVRERNVSCCKAAVCSTKGYEALDSRWCLFHNIQSRLLFNLKQTLQHWRACATYFLILLSNHRKLKNLLKSSRSLHQCREIFIYNDNAVSWIYSHYAQKYINDPSRQEERCPSCGHAWRKRKDTYNDWVSVISWAQIF